MVYDTVFRFVYEGVDYVANEVDSDAMVMPAAAGPASNANPTRFANHEKRLMSKRAKLWVS